LGLLLLLLVIRGLGNSPSFFVLPLLLLLLFVSIAAIAAVAFEWPCIANDYAAQKVTWLNLHVASFY